MSGDRGDKWAAGTWLPLTMFPGWADELMPIKERPKGVPKAHRPWRHTWCDHTKAGGTLAVMNTQPAPILPLQRAVPARLADADTVLYPSAGLSFCLA